MCDNNKCEKVTKSENVSSWYVPTMLKIALKSIKYIVYNTLDDFA